MKQVTKVLLCTLLLCGWAYAQKTVVNVVSDFTTGTEGNLNTAVLDAVNAGTLSTTQFMLEPYGYYILSGTIVVPAGEILEITAPAPGTTQAAAPPQIMWTASGGVNKDMIFECYGDLSLKNLWLMYATTGGAQVGTQIRFFDDPVANASGKGEVGIFENVIFDYSSCPPSAGGAVTVTAAHFKGTFKNCYFRNCIDTHLRYYGRALSFPYGTSDWHNDTVYFENCTFANIGYVYMQEGNEYGSDVYFNHCTFLNSMMFVLESGWWHKMNVTNSVFVNTYILGDIPALRGEGDFNGGTIRIDSVANFGFAVPFGEQDRRILFTNNSYFIEKWLVDHMYKCEYSKEQRRNREPDQVPVPQPMLSPGTLVFFDSTYATGEKAFPFMNRANLYDATDPGFIVPPTDSAKIKVFAEYKWSTNADLNWAYNPDDGVNQIWPVNENLAYTNATLQTAAMGGHPLGDLYHWWPNDYPQWLLFADGERARILAWRENGIDPATAVEEPPAALPSRYALNQNYPNPFNPSTRIDYTIPVTGHVSLKVYNTLGQEVATLFDGTRLAGTYSAAFDATGLTSGVYYYRLQSETVTLTRKLVFME